MTILTREQHAQRLLIASERHTLDPATNIDWTAVPQPDAPWMTWSTVSLYGTPLWAELSVRQRLDLSRHEVASLTGTGIWLERVLMHMLLRHTAGEDPRSAHARYALTEIADECRHSVMFGQLLEKLGTPAYSPSRLTNALGALLVTTARSTEIFAAALIGEEILDWMQRQTMADETVQPLVRQVDRVHVVEEARHVSFARDELVRQWSALGPVSRHGARLTIAGSIPVVMRAFLHPGVYASVGIDPVRARTQIARSAHRRETMRTAAAKLTQLFVEIGLIGGPSRAAWQRCGLLD